MEKERQTEIRLKYQETIKSLDDLLISVLKHVDTLKNSDAVKFGKYGIGRRINRIRQCHRRFYATFQKECEQIEVSDDERFEQTAMLNLCLIDIAGGLDNLARMILLEKKVSLPNLKISLSKDETLDHMPKKLVQKINIYTDWLDYLKEFRDPLAHRISPYVLPYVVYTDGRKSYESFYTHDFEETGLVHFHPQMIVDGMTFHELIKAGIEGTA